jgi:hypothetical protein
VTNSAGDLDEADALAETSFAPGCSGSGDDEERRLLDDDTLDVAPFVAGRDHEPRPVQLLVERRRDVDALGAPRRAALA